MAIDLDDLMPRKQTPQPVDISRMSIDELKARIGELEDEIERCRASIAAKEKQRDAASSIFKS